MNLTGSIPSAVLHLSTYWQSRHKHSCGSWCHWPPGTPCSCCPRTSWRTGPGSHPPPGIHRRGSTRRTWAWWTRGDRRLGTERRGPSEAPESSPAPAAVKESYRDSTYQFTWCSHNAGQIHPLSKLQNFCSGLPALDFSLFHVCPMADILCIYQAVWNSSVKTWEDSELKASYCEPTSLHLAHNTALQSRHGEAEVWATC